MTLGNCWSWRSGRVCSVGSVAITGCADGSSPAEEASTDSVAVVDVSGTIEEGASYSDEATNDDRRLIVVTRSVKAAGAYRGEGIGSLVRALYEKEMCCPADESNTSYDAVADRGVKPERKGVNWGTWSKPEEIAP